MKNVKATVEGTILTIRVDISQQLGPSSTGKSMVVGTTNGFVGTQDIEGLPEGVILSLNVNKVVKLTEEQKKLQKQMVAKAKVEFRKQLVTA